MAFVKFLTRNLMYALIIAILALIVLLILNQFEAVKFWWLAVALAVLILANAAYKAWLYEPPKKKNIMFRYFSAGVQIFIVLIIILGLWGIVIIFRNSVCTECAAYKAIGVGIVAIWACVFLVYFIWAIYFYNIRLGLTEEEWDKVDVAKEKKLDGDLYSEEDLAKERNNNPYKEETFGLPTGTVRGMIAFTLLFGSLAMLIVSVGMKSELDPNTNFWDHYEFFKTAFLMMIAFYFGDRSLKYLRKERQKPDEPDQDDELPDPDMVSGKSSKRYKRFVEELVANMQDPMSEKDAEGDNEEDDTQDNSTRTQTVSTKLVDPMKDPKK